MTSYFFALKACIFVRIMYFLIKEKEERLLPYGSGSCQFNDRLDSTALTAIFATGIFCGEIIL